MTSSTTPKPGDRLRQHAEDLRSGRLRWVQGDPRGSSNEACAIVSGDAAWWATEEEGIALDRVAQQRGSYGIVSYNHHCTLPEVISALEAAADLLDKEGE